jgi:hypothetical protein
MRIEAEKEMEIDSEQKCIRAGDLVSWLYSESDPDEARSFQQHLQSCHECRKDAETLRGVRQSIVRWRDNSLGAFTSMPATRPVIRQRSASAAIKEFFALSPLWMRGAVGFASILFCILVVLTVVRMRETPQTLTSMAPSHNEQEISTLVEERAQQRLRELQANLDKRTVSRNSISNPQVVAKPTTAGHRTAVPAAANLPARTRRPLTREERLQLAADLRLIEEPEPVELELISDRLARQDE